VIAALHGRARFFKHANTDPECVLTVFDEGEVDAVLFAASHDFQELAGGGPMEAQAFELWFWAIHEAHPDSESEIVRAVRRTFPDIKLLSREEQRRVGRELLEWASKRPGAAGSYARVVSLDAMRSR
jgi:hypothetical protein